MSVSDASSSGITSTPENGCETSERKQEDVVSSSSDTVEKGGTHPPQETVAEDQSTATPPDSTQNENTQQRAEIAAAPPKLRHDWYQTQADVYINIMIKRLKREDVSVKFDERRLEVVITMGDGSSHQLVFALAHNIVPQKSSFKVLGTKVSEFLSIIYA